MPCVTSEVVRHTSACMGFASALYMHCTVAMISSSMMCVDVCLQNNAIGIKGSRAQSAEPNGITASLQTEVDLLQQGLDASNKRTSWLRHRLVTATQAKSTAVQVCQTPFLFLCHDIFSKSPVKVQQLEELFFTQSAMLKQHLKVSGREFMKSQGALSSSSQKLASNISQHGLSSSLIFRLDMFKTLTYV